MKRIIPLIVSIFITSVTQVHAVNTYLLAKVSGTVKTQTLLSVSDGRVHSAKLSNATIFSQFQVSETDYQLAFSVNGTAGLYLVPKHTSAALPIIAVVTFGDNTQEVVDTKARIIDYTADLAPGIASNLFQALDGEATGSFHYTGTFGSPVFTSATLTVIGHGTDQGGNGGALLSFKITVKGSFTQVP